MMTAFLIPVILSFAIVFACVPQVLLLLLSTERAQRRNRRPIDSVLAKVKRYLANTLQYLTISTDVATKILATSEHERSRRQKKRGRLERTFFYFLVAGTLTRTMSKRPTTNRVPRDLRNYARQAGIPNASYGS